MSKCRARTLNILMSAVGELKRSTPDVVCICTISSCRYHHVGLMSKHRSNDRKLYCGVPVHGIVVVECGAPAAVCSDRRSRTMALMTAVMLHIVQYK